MGGKKGKGFLKSGRALPSMRSKVNLGQGKSRRSTRYVAGLKPSGLEAINEYGKHDLTSIGKKSHGHHHHHHEDLSKNKEKLL